MLPAILWNPSPEIIKIGFLTIRWYNCLFLAPFLIGTPILYKMFARAGRSNQEADSLRTYVMFGVIAGARLGHVIFYQWDDYKDRLLEIFLPVVFYPEFKVVGFQGLASHGAAFGVLTAIFLYVKRFKFSMTPFRISCVNRTPGTGFWSIVDYVVILTALGGASIRIGNFMNGEIIGKPTGGNYGIVFAREVYTYLSSQYEDSIEQLTMGKASGIHTNHKVSHQPIQLTIAFKQHITDEQVIKEFLENSFKKSLVYLSHLQQPMLYEPVKTPLHYTLSKGAGYQATVYTTGVLRHPAQLYEAFSCILIFVGLFWWWHKKGQLLASGRISGAFLLILFLLRFFYEFYKENQEAFEDTMQFNMGQLLSLPFVVLGLYLVLRPAPKPVK
ncbi:MAG: prolipoprotein diacylglyceryl transferase [Amoebophilaceae bacterium]|nr:prolipoprotein diacylglyceryl transferase [Amoebophilaceae bacterium]